MLNDSNIGESKRDARAKLLLLRAHLSAAERAAQSNAIQYRVLGHPVWRAAGSVAGYMATAEEAATTALLQNAVASGKRVALPRVRAGRLDWYEVTDFRPGIQLQRGVFGILEPRERCPVWQPSGGPQPVVWLVPGVGFDRAGRRLGRGGGYYDRALAAAGVENGTMGLAFACQLADEIPAGARDWRMRWIITPDGCQAAAG